MDPLSDLLRAPRAADAFLLRVVMAPPWSVRVQDGAPLTVMAVTSGSAVLRPGSGPAVELGAGDVALVRGPDPYVVADRDGTAPQAVIHPGGRCETPDGVSLELAMRQGVRSWGNAGDGPDTLLVGTYERAGEVGARLLAPLPGVVVLRAGEARSPLLASLVAVLAGQAGADDLGQAGLLDRLLDAVVVAACREWATGARTVPAWWRGDDPVVRQALALLHDEPARPWTVASLAHAVGLSRAALARRFGQAVGEPPMAYLTAWRLALAADRLRDGQDTVAAVSRAVGYTSPFTFSTAFKRRYGRGPLAWRQEAGRALAG
ncbi:AraC family transcriptional regulator [Microlunatus flavus]|uniref:AraC-type DNA-binding protein n=1 Tax=Microlunatus flavus TaxID=1036181 RepID=A0A1H9ASE6_9ACTN|nr:AraC family transcriptional regulator [Microlunatus flavus]SEP79397.1 AraC-type DNA-binding protein [Microlunatus flavus]